MYLVVVEFLRDGALIHTQNIPTECEYPTPEIINWCVQTSDKFNVDFWVKEVRPAWDY